MNCPQCTNMMTQAQATSFGEQYWYCRSCKKELAEMAAPKISWIKPTRGLPVMVWCHAHGDKISFNLSCPVCPQK